MEAIVIVIILVSFLAVVLFLKLPKTKGAVGELLIKLGLGGNIPNEKYVINDLLLYIDGKSHQIDHVVIRKTGIFVIETKNYSGQVYGQYNQKQWTQVLAYGQKNTDFIIQYSKTKTTYTH